MFEYKFYCNKVVINTGKTSVRPQLMADLHYWPSTHRLSTMILRRFTPLYGKIYRGDADFRIRSKNESVFLGSFDEAR